MHGGQRAAQTDGIGRYQDELHMIRHQLPGPHLYVRRLAIRSEQIAVKGIVAVLKERARPAIAALGDVMKTTGDD